MKRLLLIRHGEAEGAEGRAVGHLDLPLSPAGTERIRLLAEAWSAPAPQRFAASDLRRAAESARWLALRIGREPEADPRLRELSFGDWEGLTWDEIHRRDPERFAAWGERWWEVAPPGGETFEELARRALAWAAEVRDGETAVAVTHAGVIRALLAGLAGVPRGDLFRIPLAPGRVTALAVEGGGGRVVCVDSTAF